MGDQQPLTTSLSVLHCRVPGRNGVLQASWLPDPVLQDSCWQSLTSKEERGGGGRWGDGTPVFDWRWEQEMFKLPSLCFSRPGTLTQPHSTWNCPTQDSGNIRLCKGGMQYVNVSHVWRRWSAYCFHCSPLQRYKAYAMHRDTYNLFVLFTSTTPTFALR